MEGYGGTLLRVDLGRGTIVKEPLSEGLAAKFVGGSGINDWLLWEHFLKVNPRIDPLQEENVLILGLGPLGGTGIGLGSKMKFTFKSPLTGFFGDTTAGGTLASQLRWAGYDHVVITGRAPHPVYLWIEDDRVEIRDARPLWGKGTGEAIAHIRQEAGNEEVGVGCIGPAGENLVRYACVILTHERAAGRMGAGCVMGSKNLKAIAARGTRGIRVHDPRAFLEVTRELFRMLDANLAHYSFKKNGTVGVADLYERIGDLAYRNDRYSLTPRSTLDKLRASWAYEHVKRDDFACSPGCTIGCGSWLNIKGNESSYARRIPGTLTAGPELYATVTFGMACDVPDFVAVSALHNLCNHYGIDGLEMGSLIPFLMELWERGIIGERETRRWAGQPLSFTWGNLEAIEKTVESVGRQDNDLGRLLQRGIVPAAQEIERLTEQPTLPYAVYGKGGVSFQKEVRSFPSWAIGFAVSSRGADHLKASQQVEKACREDISQAWLGDPGAARPFCPDRKGALVAYAENRNAAINALGICYFGARIDLLEMDRKVLPRAFEALTGIEMTGEGLYRVGERIYNLEKAFNSRVGLRRQDDLLCQRWMKEPLQDGPGKGMKVEDYFEALLDEYYTSKGWDPATSLQTREKLEELGLEEVAEVLAKEGAVGNLRFSRSEPRDPVPSRDGK